MIKYVMTAALALILVSTAAEAKTHHKKSQGVLGPSLVWCGAPNASEKYRFPYLASIQVFKFKHGRKSEVVTIYEKNRVVFRQLVQKQYANTGLTYRTTDDDFNLKFTPNAEKDSFAGFRAVIHDQDGVKLIANGEFLCHQS